MIKWLIRFSEQLIFWLFMLLLSLTYLFAWLSPNLTLGDNLVFGTSTSAWLLGIYLVVLLIGISFIFLPAMWHVLAKQYQRYKIGILFCFVLIVFGIQVLFVFFFHPEMGWDVSALHQGVVSPTAKSVESYYSLNINNLPIVWLMSRLSQLFQTQSWLFFDLITLVFVDVSAIFITLTVAIVRKQAVEYTILLQGFFLLVFPWIVVPYTDAWVLPLVSGYLLAYTYLLYRAKTLWRITSVSVMFALLVMLTYFMKPSSVIPFFAIVIQSFFQFIKQKTHRKKRIFTFFIVAIVLVGGFIGGKQLFSKQTMIAVDESRAIPAIHFINMGISNEGGYNPEDALMMEKLFTKEEKTAYSWNSYTKRLKERGVLGYASFLVRKQRNNTADGTFAWLKEGTFFKEDKPSSKGVSGFLEDSFYLYGERIADYRYLAQIIWLVILTPVLLAFYDRRPYINMLRLSVLGAFLFLLIFEGGRSRYMIQFLPIFLIFSSIEAYRIKIYGKKLWQAIYYAPEERMKLRTYK